MCGGENFDKDKMNVVRWSESLRTKARDLICREETFE